MNDWINERKDIDSLMRELSLGLSEKENRGFIC